MKGLRFPVEVYYRVQGETDPGMENEKDNEMEAVYIQEGRHRDFDVVA